MREFERAGRVLRLTPGFKTLTVAEGAVGKRLAPVEELSFMSNGERDEAMDVRATTLGREGWSERALAVTARKPKSGKR